MGTLDGKITIEIGLRPCIVKNSVKALFHFYHPVTGNAIVEYEDGTIHEVEPTQMRFVDNAMSEYAFQEMEEKS